MMSRLCCSWGATALRVGDAVNCHSIFCPNCTPTTSLASPCLSHKRVAFLLWRSMRKWKRHTTRRRTTKGINMIGGCIHVMTTGAWVVRQPLPPCIVPFSFAFFFGVPWGVFALHLKSVFSTCRIHAGEIPHSTTSVVTPYETQTSLCNYRKELVLLLRAISLYCCVAPVPWYGTKCVFT